METQFERLNRIRFDFQPHITNPKLLYTFIAPKEKGQYDSFLEIVQGIPKMPLSLYEILSDIEAVKKILLEYFPKDIELEIYIANKDVYTYVFTNGTLKKYIEMEGINFEYE